MWLAEFPLAQHTSAGQPSGSTNPLTDDHVICALCLMVLAATYAGTTWNSAGSRPAYRSSTAGVIDPGQPSLRVRPT